MINLYLIFAQIGILAFGGGYATLPLIQRLIVDKMGWINMNTMLDIISISQMTPGPIAINSASFVGDSVGGILGSIVATIGVVTPQIIILSIFLKFVGTDNKYVKYVLDGINPAVIALILIAAISLIKSAVVPNINILIGAIFAVSAILSYKNVSIIKLIAMGAVVGILGSYIHA